MSLRRAQISDVGEQKAPAGPSRPRGSSMGLGRANGTLLGTGTVVGRSVPKNCGKRVEGGGEQETGTLPPPCQSL